MCIEMWLEPQNEIVFTAPLLKIDFLLVQSQWTYILLESFHFYALALNIAYSFSDFRLDSKMPNTLYIYCSLANTQLSPFAFNALEMFYACVRVTLADSHRVRWQTFCTATNQYNAITPMPQQLVNHLANQPVYDSEYTCEVRVKCKPIEMDKSGSIFGPLSTDKKIDELTKLPS